MSANLQIDPQRFSQHFGHEPLRVSHTLTEHELLTKDSLAELAEALPEEAIEHNLGSVDAVNPDLDAPKVDLPPAEVVRSLEETRSWMVLKNIEQVPAYQRLLDEALDQVAPLVENHEGGMLKRMGFIFLSAPDSTTPAHIDPEHNFLLQVRGTKRMTLGEYPEGESRAERVERFHGNYRAGRNLSGLPTNSTDYDLGPGDGIYVPPHDPHWVKNGPETSISLSVTFYTPATQVAADANAINHRLRKLRISPTPVGEHPSTDRAKSKAVHTARRAMSIVRR